MILNSALDISELKETQSSLLHTKDELARKNMSLSSALSLAKVIPWGCDVERDVFYCDYDAYHPDNASGPDKHGHYMIPTERYFAGVHPDYRQEAIRMIAELKEGKRTNFTKPTWSIGSTNANGNGCRCSAVFPAEVWAGNPFR